MSDPTDFYFFSFVVSTGLSVLAAAIAGHKNRSQLWWSLTTFAVPLSFFVLIFLRAQPDDAQTAPVARKRPLRFMQPTLQRSNLTVLSQEKLERTSHVSR